MKKQSFSSLTPYLDEPRFVITNTGIMYLFINGVFLCRKDGLKYQYTDIDPIYVISPINYLMVAYGMNRWNVTWVYKNFIYQNGEYPF